MLLVKVFMTAMENTFTLNFIVDTEFYSLKQRLWVYFFIFIFGNSEPYMSRQVSYH